MRHKPTDTPAWQEELINVGKVKKAKGQQKKIQMDVIQKDMDDKDFNRDIEFDWNE